MKEIIAWVMADRNERAPLGGPGNSTTVWLTWTALSAAVRPMAKAMAAATNPAGTSQIWARSTSLVRLHEPRKSRSGRSSRGGINRVDGGSAPSVGRAALEAM